MLELLLLALFISWANELNLSLGSVEHELGKATHVTATSAWNFEFLPTKCKPLFFS